jgi:hypothetical protein
MIMRMLMSLHALKLSYFIHTFAQPGGYSFVWQQLTVELMNFMFSCNKG